jgi:predicted nuclease of predicted toxin-antitoxin system
VKLKLDENFDIRLIEVLTSEGHDVDTVLAEGLSGCNDDTVYEVCRSKKRVLITLDLDFSNPFRFPPFESEGIVAVRPPRPVLSAIRATLTSALPQLKTQSQNKKLWIVEPGRIRIYDPHEEQDLT